MIQTDSGGSGAREISLFSGRNAGKKAKKMERVTGFEPATVTLAT